MKQEKKLPQHTISGINIAIGQFIRDFRNSLGLTTNEMAEKLGVKQRSYVYYEQGKSDLSYQQIRTLIDLGLNPCKMFGAECGHEGKIVSKVKKTEKEFCQECESKSREIAFLKDQLKEQRIDLIRELGQARPTTAKDNATETRDSERKRQQAHSGFR